MADALVAKATDTLNQAVTDGKLTQEKADKAEAKLPELATRVIDHHKGDHQAKATDRRTDPTRHRVRSDHDPLATRPAVRSTRAAGLAA